ncbi:TetR/AcrR family transcriptional regulator [Sphingomonas profundi]|uniref:TetR/AcrR family transcriptional regulator n=1 Tax=Alterirhizorhabdus profundi TaxID=2681549 RepID=UPI0018D1430C|nr:TetR/AcrR family transcriptional regulator [Sphingomonas profundi]
MPEPEAAPEAHAADIAPAEAPAPRKRRRSATQVQRNEATRLQLLEAAGKVIGKHGYAGCTIARVTTRTKIAHGTFYLHFASQQDLFDAVLPTLGGRMLASIGRAIHAATDAMELERRGFEANFAYLSRHPYMYRVLSEAELFAPAAFHGYMDRMTRGYVRSLQRSKAATQLADYSADELESIATMLIGARTYLLMRYGIESNAVKPLPAAKLDTYLKFVAHGILGDRALHAG